MNLNEVNVGITGSRPRKRLGRGPGSGQGKTGGRGHKGQRSRPGRGQSVVFQGGTMPLFRRIPKRGFTNSFADVVASVNIRDLEREFSAGDEVNIQTLQGRNLAKRTFDQLKILGTGELTKALNVTAHQFSATAKAKIEQAGGSVTVLPGPAPVVKNKQRSAKK
ncbi:MAG: 50S ribosomal protein L15 [Pirellulaceae bacterium]|nr:50S ribosomal protein L15 [Pirellulaceae bacterium]